MTTPSDTQHSKSETSEPSNLGNQCSKKETEESKTGLMAVVGKLSAAAIPMIGIIYVMGYVIVNGYQAKYMNYSANALQLKHLAAGVLYTMLTLFQVCIVAFFLQSALIDVLTDSTDNEKATAGRNWWQRSWHTVKTIRKYSWAIGKSLVLAFFFSLLFLRFVGISLAPTTLGPLAILREILPWVVINLLLSIVIVIGLYRSGSKDFKAFSEVTALEDASPEQASADQESPQQDSPKQPRDEKKHATTLQIPQQRLRRIFIEAKSKLLTVYLYSFVLLLFSLISFQGLYGRLMPDYGGGALHRVAIHLKSSNSVPSPSATPSPGIPSPNITSSSGSLSADWRESIKSKDSWLLLVDKDGAFVYVLCVDGKGKKQLLEIASSEVEALEVLADPPISPADARFFIQ